LLAKSSEAHPFSLLAPMVPVSPLILSIDPAKRTSLLPASGVRTARIYRRSFRAYVGGAPR
jgi:hypothetical protein